MSDQQIQIKLEDLKGDQRELAEVIGIDNYVKLLKYYSGDNIYIAKYDSVVRQNRNDEIYNDYIKGITYDGLRIKYNLSENSIRKIIADKKIELSEFGEQTKLF